MQYEKLVKVIIWSVNQIGCYAQLFAAGHGAGGQQALQDLHEAYQVLTPLICARNTFIKKAGQKREQNIKTAEHVATAANIFKKKTFGSKLWWS